MSILDRDSDFDSALEPEPPASPDQILGELGLSCHAVREILDDVSSEPALDLRAEG